MKPIEKYIEAMENKDFAALGELFTKEGHLCDYCPNGTPQHEYHLYGREAISMFSETSSLSASIPFPRLPLPTTLRQSSSLPSGDFT